MSACPLPLSPEDKLDVLHYLDEFHYWHSLDDERFCKRCGHVITGRQILVLESHGTRGKLRLQCPTVGCISRPSEWVYADPILAAKLRRDFHPETRALTAAAPPERVHHGHGCGVHRGSGKTGTPLPNAPAKQNHVSFRALIARLPLLRSLATALHAIHPVA